MNQRVAGAVLAALLLVMGLFVWPTAWRYDELRHRDRVVLARTHRFTGKVQFLGKTGWVDSNPALAGSYESILSGLR